MQAPPAQPPVPWPSASRARGDVETLTREVASLRGQLAGAKAGTATTDATVHKPAGTASATPSAPVPPSAVLPPRAPAQPAAARADASASVSAPAPTPFAPPRRHRHRPPRSARAKRLPPGPHRRRLPRRQTARADLVERAFRAARDWLLGGNTVVRVGIIVLFFGVAFLLKYAADNNMLPIEFRLAGTALAAAALLAIGWRARAVRGPCCRAAASASCT